MDVTEGLRLLGGLSPRQFMRRHWQKKPLLIRQAVAASDLALDAPALFALAARDEVESRLVERPEAAATSWKLRHGPFSRRALPPLARPGWSLLVQGVDLHVEQVHRMLERFRFVPEARLDDVMVSYASDAGGVGPHFDSYDVFLLQARGRRRWRIGRQKDLTLLPDAPLKILRHFEPEQEFDLDPGDMLYLPPGYAHDGLAIGPCMTWSVGFRAPSQSELAAELLQRLAQETAESEAQAMYRDASQQAVDTPASIPAGLLGFAHKALQSALKDPSLVNRCLGEYLTEPKAQVWFEAGGTEPEDAALRLDRRTRMMYEREHVFINGESYRAKGRDALLMRRLADTRELSVDAVVSASKSARSLLREWRVAGWVHGF
ncbi:MAG: cupin domain-containing protein [Burkholderiaceae bacterium]